MGRFLLAEGVCAGISFAVVVLYTRRAQAVLCLLLGSVRLMRGRKQYDDKEVKEGKK